MFYIIERSDQLQQLKPLGDCFVRFIPKNNNYHPSLTSLSLIYIRSTDKGKGYMLCLDHNESFSLNQTEVFNWLLSNTNNIWVLDKKEAMYWFPHPEKLFDAHLLEFINLTEALSSSPCIDYYYTNHINLPNVNCLIPISKHYEECDAIFKASLPIIKKYNPNDNIFKFNNEKTTNVFYQIEKNGIKLDKTCFINYYKGKLQHPEFNLSKSRIYTQYNLYNTTSRPSNTYNSINFAALNKEDGERICYKPDNDMFIEFDYKAFHIVILSNLIEHKWDNIDIHNELGKQYFNKLELTEGEYNQSKTITFSQIYGYIREEYKQIPFFKKMQQYIDNIWNQFQSKGYVSTPNKIFNNFNIENNNPNKLLNYIIQSYETVINVETLELVLNYLKNKKSKIVLYVYDSYLIDLDINEQYIVNDIKNIIEEVGYKTSIKIGKDYQSLSKM